MRGEKTIMPDRRELMRKVGSPLRNAAVAASDRTRTIAPGTRLMRRPSRVPPSKVLPTPPSAAVIALNRLAFGPRPGDIAQFNSLGSTDEVRLTAYVDRQLNPSAIDDSACDARLASAGFTTLNKSQGQLWQDHVLADPDWYVRTQPLREIERAAFLRATHSQRHLLEVLADFWHNHFNVYGWGYWTAPLWVHWDRDVIRANVMGNFRQMLEGVATAPEMLYYLDNYTSSNAGPNENYARELLELHTLGAENYFGVMLQDDVPTDDSGRPLGYVDEDVFEATRCLTGWTIDFDTGFFEYRDDWHDRFQKHVLGDHYPSDQPPMKDGQDLLDALATHPGTGRFIARKLCRRLISDDPPQGVVDAAAAVFSANVDASDQLAQVVRIIVLSDEFPSTWGEKIKRPFEIAASTLRATQAEFSWALDESAVDSLFWMYEQGSQPLFSWRSPDGFSDVKEPWKSTTPRVGTWRFVNWLIDEEDNGIYRADVVAQTPDGIRSATALADFWILRILGRTAPEIERGEIIDFMAQGHNPDFDLPLDSDDGTQERLRSMVGLICMSPSFLWR